MAVGSDDVSQRTMAKLILSITLVKHGMAGDMVSSVFPSSVYDSWTSLQELSGAQAATLDGLLAWGQGDDQNQRQSIDNNNNNNNTTTKLSSAASRCLFSDVATLQTTRSPWSLRLDNAYPPLLFAENDGTGAE